MSVIESIIREIENLVPEVLKNPLDKNLNNGNASLCIIDENGQVFGKLFGTDKNKMRQTFKTAWTKASQVWITGFKTGEYEKLVFNKEINEHDFGIIRPDFIGWEGGQPIVLKDGTKLSIGFSGFRGVTDLEIVINAINKLNL